MSPLEESIAHWERMRDFTDCSQFQEEYIGTDHCSLCREHRGFYPEETCGDCPVAKNTGREFCLGSPYNAAERAFERLYYGSIKEDWDDWRKAAQTEVDFLKSLLTEND